MAKVCRLPKDSRNTVINANIGSIYNTLHQYWQHKQHITRVPSHYVQQKRLLELRPLTGKSGPSQMGVVLQAKKMDLSQMQLKFTTLNPTKSPH
jgi:hypothetical protein